jgi:hypothetical protein
MAMLASKRPSNGAAIVVWPDGPIVIRHRVVARLDGGDRANPPSRKHLAADKRLSDATCSRVGGNATEQAMTRIRAAYPTHAKRRPLREADRLQDQLGRRTP